MFIKLPLLLIQHIIDYVESNIDRITLIFVCKRLYLERNRYLKLKADYDIKNNRSDHYLKDDDDNNSNNKFKLIIQVIKNSFKNYVSPYEKDIHYYHNDNNKEFNIPTNTTVLHFGHPFVEIGDSFNRKIPVNCIPESVQVVRLGHLFNQPLEPNIFPKSVKYVRLSYKFNQPLRPGIFPYGIEYVKFGMEFQQSISEGILPPTVKKLRFRSSYRQPVLKNYIPSSVEKIVGVPHLENFHIPTSVKYIVLGKRFNFKIPIGSLPNSCTQLIFGDPFNQPIEAGAIPSSVKYLKFGYKFNRPLQPGVIPHGCTQLIFGGDFNQPIEANVIPSSLRSLVFGRSFNHPLLLDVLPKDLEQLHLGFSFKFDSVEQSLEFFSTVAPQLKRLTLGYLLHQDKYPEFFNSFDLQSVISNTTIKEIILLTEDEPLYSRITIRIIDDKYVLIMNESLDGGFMSIENLVGLSKLPGSLYKYIAKKEIDHSYSESDDEDDLIINSIDEYTQ